MKKKRVLQTILSLLLAFAMVITVAPIAGLDSFVAMAADEGNLSSVYELDDNLLTNWDGIWTGEGGAGNAVVNADGSVEINVTQAGNQNYAIQYTHVLKLEIGAKYVLSGDFYCESDAKVSLNIQESKTNNWASILNEEDQTINIKAGENYHYEAETLAATEPFVDSGKIALMFGNMDINVGKTIRFSNVKLQKILGEKVDSDVPTYTKISSNLATTFKACHEDWVEWSSASSTNYDNNSVVIDIKGYEGYEGYQTRVENVLTLEEGKNYVIVYDITSSKNKKTLFHIERPDYSTIVDDFKYDLLADTRSTVTLFTGKMPSTVESARVFAAFGMIGSDATDPAFKAGEHSITVQDFAIYEIEEDIAYAGFCEKSRHTNKLQGATPKGPEHDFSVPDNNHNPSNVKDGYTLIWADEFNGYDATANVDAKTGLNLDNWAYQLGDGTTDCGNTGWGNNELQCYTGNTKNIGVNEDLNGDKIPEGVLRITASYEADGYKYENESSKKYTSARIRSTKAEGELFNLTYGYVEARIALPQTPGAWPAFWMLPQSTSIYGGWPVSGEIDILETVGSRENEACGTLHWGSPVHVYKGSGYVSLDSSFTNFHTYAVDW